MPGFSDINAHDIFLGCAGDGTSFSQMMNGAGRSPWPAGWMDASFSPNGLEVVLTDVNRQHIWIYKQDGTFEYLYVTGQNIWRPTLAANGVVVFQSNENGPGTPAIYKVTRGTLGADLTKLQSNAIEPCVSADGSWLAYSINSSVFPNTCQVCTMKIDGSNAFLLTGPGGGGGAPGIGPNYLDSLHPDARMPSISPSGTRITYMSGQLFGVDLSNPNAWQHSDISWSYVNHHVPDSVDSRDFRYIGDRTVIPISPEISIAPCIALNPCWALCDNTNTQNPEETVLVYDYISEPSSSGTWAVDLTIIDGLGHYTNYEQVYPNPHAGDVQQACSNAPYRTKRI